MRKFWIPFTLAGVAAAIVSAQTLVESATAAAGGTAAAAAGKKVSDGIDSVFGALGGIAKEAAGKDDKSKPRRTIDPAPLIPEVRLGTGTTTSPATALPLKKPVGAASGNVATKRVSAVAAAPDAVVPAVEAQPAVQPVITAPPITAGDVAGIAVGSSRQDIAGKLGKPSSRITMDDGGKLVEVYTYRSQGASIGSLRLVDGQVAEVRPAK